MSPKPLQSYSDLKTPKKPKGPKERFDALKDEGLREYVRGLPCLVLSDCTYGNCREKVEAAHVTTKGAAGGDWDNLVPLCGYHHRQQHTLGIRSWEYRYQVRLKAAARKVTAAYVAQRKHG